VALVLGVSALGFALWRSQPRRLPGNCSTITASGLGYSVKRQGRGHAPTDTDIVLVNYTGMLADGRTFDKGSRVPFPVDQVVSGFAEGLKLMKKGGSARLCIPAALGYGENAAGPIPANADLIFDLELIDFTSAEALEAALQKVKGVAPQADLPEGVD
jgi:FKBP-type peptidyl-prolyl cis-trans isomerase FkpA